MRRPYFTPKKWVNKRGNAKVTIQQRYVKTLALFNEVEIERSEVLLSF